MLKIGQPNTPLILLHQHHQVTSSAYITAWNPYSDKTSPEQNTQRQSQLLSDMQRDSYPVYQGEGKHPSGDWDCEASLLVLGISLEDARALGYKWEQNAIVWSGADGVPQLILLQ
ncbi:MAG: DUF3293 domain-containing protein [Pseudohongiella sp.]|nr:DUF3293 domain-containing protein [Pseudohongiella sp.]